MPIDLGRGPYIEFGLGEYFDSYVSEAHSAAVALRQTCALLPKVDELGRSDCHFAEQLFAQKEEKEKQVRRLLEQFQAYRAAIGQELPTALARVARIEATEQRLHGDGAKRQVDQAALEAQAAYAKLVHQQQQALIVIEELVAVFNVAASKKWPLGPPKKAGPSWGGATAGGPTRNRERDVSPFRKEVDSLLRRENTVASPARSVNTGNSK